MNKEKKKERKKNKKNKKEKNRKKRKKFDIVLIIKTCSHLNQN